MIELFDIQKLLLSENGKYNPHLNRQSWWENRNLVELYSRIKSMIPSDIYTVKDFIHVTLNNMTFPRCKECGAYCSFYDGTQVREFCSKTCRANNSDVYSKYKKTNLERHGVSNPFLLPQPRSAASYKLSYQKSKSTLLNRYGVEHNSQIKAHTIDNFTGFESFTRRELSEILNIPYTSLNNIIRNNKIEVKQRAEFTDVELVIRDILNSTDIEYETHVRSKIKPYELDFYIPCKSLAIEVHGIYWHCLSKVDKDLHSNKCNLCESAGIKLLQFTDIEINNSIDICKSMILSCLGRAETIYARRCEFIEIDSSDARIFHNTNHINGYVPSKFNYGLSYNGDIVCVASFSASRFNSNSKFELIRFSSKLNTRVVGGFSKIVKHSGIDSFITYANRRYSSINSNVYDSCGLSYLGTTKPNYFYTKNYRTLESRHKYQKHKLGDLFGDEFDSNISEFQNMMNFGYDIFYDAGNNIYKYEK